LILPYVISSERLKWQPFYVGYNVYSYSRDILAGLIGVGLSSPVMELASKALGPDSTKSSTTALQDVFVNIPKGWKIIVIIALFVLVTLKASVVKVDAEKLATLARSCRREFQGISTELLSALSSADPMAEVIELQNKITAIVRRYMSEGSWPWAPFPNGIDPKVNARTQELYSRFGANWVASAAESGQSLPPATPADAA
jgi:uncharacterized membrane protein (Fun14 family)